MNYDCTDSSKPYCSLTSFNGVTPVYTCVQCVSGCDCSRNDFCSQAPGNVGTCQKFKKYGDDCRALSSQQIMNSTFPDKWKCAATFTVNGTIFIDQAGVCNAGTCRYCVPYSFNGICRLDTGKAEERYCVYPGYFVAGHSYFWQDANYYTNPKLVWLAIFFCFFIISGGVQFATAIISYRKGGIGRSKPNETKHDSVKKQVNILLLVLHNKILVVPIVHLIEFNLHKLLVKNLNHLLIHQWMLQMLLKNLKIKT